MRGRFAADLSEWCEKIAPEKIERSIRAAVIDLGIRLVLRSPVGKRELWAVNIDRATRGLPPIPKGYVGGLFRGSWFYSQGMGPDLSQQGQIDPSGSLSIGRIQGAISAGQQLRGTVLYIYNPLPYGIPLEEGHSHQSPPGGMVALSVMEWQSMLNAAWAANP